MKAKVRTGIVQMRVPASDRIHLERIKDHLFGQAIQGYMDGVELLLFPALTGLWGLRELSHQNWQFDRELPSLIHRFGLALEETWVTWGRALAGELNLYVCLGSTIVPSENGLKHRSYVFGPEGNIILCQDQTHVTDDEREWGLSEGNTLEMAETPVGNLGLVLGTDARVPEVARILALQGTNLLLRPGWLNGSLLSQLESPGFRSACLGNQVYGIESCADGSLGGERLRGRAAVYGPPGSGWTASGETAVSETIKETEKAVIQTHLIDYSQLARVVRADPRLEQVNKSWLVNKLLSVYPRPARPSVIDNPWLKEVMNGDLA